MSFPLKTNTYSTHTLSFKKFVSKGKTIVRNSLEATKKLSGS